MPLTFSCSSVVKPPRHDSPVPLLLRVTHRLQIDSSDHASVQSRVLPPLPSVVDVFLPPSGLLDICLLGSTNGRPHPARVIDSSGLLEALMESLCLNATSIGMEGISKLCSDDTVIIQLRSAHTPLSVSDYSPPSVTLLGLSLDLIWGFTGVGVDDQPKPTLSPDAYNSCETEMTVVDPFAPHLFLPFRCVFQDAINKLLRSLARRYPLIFHGRYIEMLASENRLLPSIAASVRHIIARSDDPEHRRMGKMLLKKLRRQNTYAAESYKATLSGYIAANYDRSCSLAGVQLPTDHPQAKIDRIITEAMTRSYRLVIRPPVLQLESPTKLSDLERRLDPTDMSAGWQFGEEHGHGASYQAYSHECDLLADTDISSKPSAIEKALDGVLDDGGSMQLDGVGAMSDGCMALRAINSSACNAGATAMIISEYTQLDATSDIIWELMAAY